MLIIECRVSLGMFYPGAPTPQYYSQSCRIMGSLDPGFPYFNPPLPPYKSNLSDTLITATTSKWHTPNITRPHYATVHCSSL